MKCPTIACLCLALALGGCRRQPAAAAQPVVRMAEVMGTYARTSFYGDEAAADAAARKVFAVFDEINAQFSTWLPDSEISRLNREAYAAPFACSPRMWELLLAAREAYELSQGGFDVTAGPLMRAWGFYRQRDALPTDDELAEVLQRVGFAKLELDETARTVRFTVADMALDFGGLAKGYAVDLAAQAIADTGITCGVIDLGGNIYCLPTPPPGRDVYNIGVRNPRDTSTILGTVPLRERAIAASGDYERFVEIKGRRYCHIMDPRSGRPVTGMANVSVLAATAMTADILSTAIFVNHGELLATWRSRYPEINVLLITADDHDRLTIRVDGDVWQDVHLNE